MIYQTENRGGTYDFRCQFQDGWVMEQHIHEYSEILYCKKGECEVLINGKPIALRENQFIWIPPNYIHQYKRTRAQLICAVFSGDLVPLYFHIAKGKWLTVKSMDAGEEGTLFERLLSAAQGGVMEISGCLNLIGARVLAQSEFESSTNHTLLYQKVISCLTERFREDVSLKQLAGMLNYNEKYLSHSLHALTGMHFSQLISMYRVENAKKLLVSEPATSVLEIALASGFSAMNTFNRTFKKATGVTPTQYRNRFFADD